MNGPPQRTEGTSTPQPATRYPAWGPRPIPQQRARNGRYASYRCDPATETRIAWIEAVLRERMRTVSTSSLVLRLAVAHYAAHLSKELETLGAVGDGKPPTLAHLRIYRAIRDALEGRDLKVTKEEACASPVRPLLEIIREANERHMIAARERLKARMVPWDYAKDRAWTVTEEEEEAP